MKYKCTIYSNNFFEKCKSIVDKWVNDKEIPKDKSYLEEFERLEAWSNLRAIQRSADTEIRDYAFSIGVLPMQTEILILPAQERGYQSQPRVMWEDKIEKIEDIDQILKYERI